MRTYQGPDHNRYQSPLSQHSPGGRASFRGKAKPECSQYKSDPHRGGRPDALFSFSRETDNGHTNTNQRGPSDSAAAIKEWWLGGIHLGNNFVNGRAFYENYVKSSRRTPRFSLIRQKRRPIACLPAKSLTQFVSENRLKTVNHCSHTMVMNQAGIFVQLSQTQQHDRYRSVRNMLNSLRALTTTASRSKTVEIAVACSRFATDSLCEVVTSRINVGSKCAAASKRAILPPR